MPSTAQDVVNAVRAADAVASDFAGVPSQAQTITDLQAQLTAAQTQLTVANGTIDTLNAEITAAKVDAKKTVADLGG